MTGSLSRPGSRNGPIVAAVVLVAAIGFAYLNSLHGAFVWDDVPSIVQNRSFEHLASILDRPKAVNTTSGRPLVSLTLGLDYAIGGRRALGFHLFNLFVHAAAALALFGFVRRLALLPHWRGRYDRDATWLALAIAGVWALHPLQTQAVTYVIQRAESLMGLCYLLTLWSFVRSIGSRRPVLWRAISVLACAAGMMAKEVMVSAPVVVLLCDRVFVAESFRRALASKRWFYTALFGTWIVLFALVFSLGGDRDGSTGGFSAHARWVAYWLTQFPAVATYLKLSFWPHPLVFQYGTFWLPNFAAALPGALLVAALIAFVVVAIVRWPEIGFLGFWCCAILAVTSVVPGTVDMIVEHRMYLASAPLWILVVAVLDRGAGRHALLALVGIALAFGAVTAARNRDYRSALALWTDNVAKRPDNALAHYNLAVELLHVPGHEHEARVQLETAVKLSPDFAAAQYNLALTLQQSGDDDGAMAHYEQAVRVAPAHSQAQNNLAMLLERRGEVKAACVHLEQAVRGDPGNRTAWLNLIRVLEELRRSDDALAAARALVRANPDFADGQARLGILLALRQQLPDAILHLDAALRLDSAQAEARYYLGTVLVQRGERLPEAISLLEAVARERPESAPVRYNLGIAYLAAGGRLPQAIRQFEAAVHLDARNANAHFNLAGALEAAGADSAAIVAHYRAAAALQPDNPVDHFRFACALARDRRARSEARTEVRKVLALEPDFPGAAALLAQLDADADDAK